MFKDFFGWLKCKLFGKHTMEKVILSNLFNDAYKCKYCNSGEFLFNGIHLNVSKFSDQVISDDGITEYGDCPDEDIGCDNVYFNTHKSSDEAANCDCIFEHCKYISVEN